MLKDKKTIILGSIAYALCIYLTYILYSPTISRNVIKQSLQQMDVDDLDVYVDFPAIKNSLKNQLKTELILKASKKKENSKLSNQLLMEMISDATRMVEEFVELFVSQNGLSRLFEMDAEYSNSTQTSAARKAVSTLQLVTKSHDNDFTVLSFNKIQIKAETGNEVEHHFIFTFRYFRWVLTDIVIDLRNVDDKKIIDFISLFQKP